MITWDLYQNQDICGQLYILGVELAVLKRVNGLELIINTLELNYKRDSHPIVKDYVDTLKVLRGDIYE